MHVQSLEHEERLLKLVQVGESFILLFLRGHSLGKNCAHVLSFLIEQILLCFGLFIHI